MDSALAGERIGHYRRANHYAARFCRRLARTLHPRGPAAHADAMAEVRRFYRLNREPKIRHIERTASCLSILNPAYGAPYCGRLTDAPEKLDEFKPGETPGFRQRGGERNRSARVTAENLRRSHDMTLA